MPQASFKGPTPVHSNTQKLCAVFMANSQPEEIVAILQRMVDAFYPHADALHVMAELPTGAMAAPEHGLFRGETGRGAVALAGAYFGADELGLADGSLAELAGDLIAQQGPTALGQLNGVFAVVYHDPKRPRVVAAVDRYGFAPLFYASVGQTLLVASELKAIAAVTRLSPDPAAYGSFFYIGHMLGDQTLFAEVKVLGPGEYLEWTPTRGATVHRYWDIATSPKAGSWNATTQEVTAAFSLAVSRRMRPECCDTVLLSGGLDSRLILATLLTQGYRPRLLTLEHAGFRRGLDGQLAQQVARAVGLETEVRSTRLRFYDTVDALEVFRILDGMVPSFGLFIGQVYSELDPSRDRVWEGLALDVAFGGHSRPGASLHSNLPYLLAAQAQNRRFLCQVFRRDWLEEIEQRFAAKLTAELDRFPDTEDGWVRFLLAHRKRRRVGLLPCQLYSRHLLALTPGVDSQFLDAMLAVPQAQRQHSRLYFELLHELCPSLLRVPVLSGETYYGVYNGEVAISQHGHRGRGRLRHWLKSAGLAPYARTAAARLSHVDSTKRDAVPAELVTRLIHATGFERDLYNRAYVAKALRKVEGGSLYWLMPLSVVFYVELWQCIFERQQVETLRRDVFREVSP